MPNLSRSLPALDRFALQRFAGFAHGKRIGNLHDDLAFAMRAQAFFPGVLIFNFEDVPVGTFNLNSHGRRPPEPLTNLEKNARIAQHRAWSREAPRFVSHDPYGIVRLSSIGGERLKRKEL
jgi:hypothetical protein